MCFLELMATPDASPRYRSGGSFSRLATDSKGISGTPEFKSAPNAAEKNGAAQKQPSAIGRKDFIMASSEHRKLLTVRYQTAGGDASASLTRDAGAPVMSSDTVLLLV